jgi:photosystem II stability/assembly factor-like uncharacterized protein
LNEVFLIGYNLSPRSLIDSYITVWKFNDTSGSCGGYDGNYEGSLRNTKTYPSTGRYQNDYAIVPGKTMPGGDYNFVIVHRPEHPDSSKTNPNSPQFIGYAHSIRLNVIDRHEMEISSITLPASMRSGGNYTIRVRVKNNGDVTETGKRISLNITNGNNYNNTISSPAIDIPAGSSRDIDFNWETIGLPAGAYTFSAMISIEGDQNTANNSKSISGQLLEPYSLSVSGTTNKPSYGEGENVILTVTVTVKDDLQTPVSGASVSYKVKSGQNEIKGLANDLLDGSYSGQFSAPYDPGTYSIEVNASKLGYLNGSVDSITLTVKDTTAPTVPTLYFPQNAELCGPEILLDWSDAVDFGSGIQGYQIQISNTEDFAIKLVDSQAGPSNYSATLNEGTYFWRVQAIDRAGNPSGWPTTLSTFKVLTCYTLTVNIVGEGTVSKNPNKTAYKSGDAVELTAVEKPGSGYTFDSWSGLGNDDTSNGKTATITMSQSKQITATFKLISCKISGYTRTTDGVGISDVAMRGLPGNPMTNASGNYTGTVGYGWSGTVTPQRVGYDFNPSSKTYVNLGSDQGQDYVGTRNCETNRWFVTGPEGGNIRSLAIDPVTESTIYAGTRESGAFKSSDGGESWVAINIGLTGTNVSSLVVDPVTTSTIYAGTDGNGVFKSTDSGGSWSAMNTGLTNTVVRSLVIDPVTPDIIYAGTWGGGVFKSTDGGESWTVINNGLASTGVSSLVIDPITPSTIYAGTGSGVYITIDAGGSWNVTNTDSNMDVNSLVLDPVTPTTIYAATQTGGVFKSTDSGWNWMNTGLTNVVVWSLMINPVTPDIIYAGTYGAGVLKSTDGGGSWNTKNSGLTSIEVRSVVVHPVTTGTIYAGTEGGGVFKSTDGGGNWTPQNSGLTSTEGSFLVIDPITSNTIYAGTRWSGVYKSMDGGGTWLAINSGLTNLTNLDISSLAIDPATPSTIYAGTWYGGVFKSTDGGASWTPINTGLISTIFPMVICLAIDPLTPATIYAGTWGGGGLFKSTDGGGNWTVMNTGLAENTAVYSLVIDPVTPTTIYAGTFWNGVYKSLNGGLSGVHTGLNGMFIYSLVIDPLTPTTVYAGSVMDTGGGVFKSVDGGGSWTRINIGLTNTEINSLAVDPVTPSIIYAGTAGGVFKNQQIPSETFTISGYVRTTESAGISGVVMSGLPNNPSTDVNGYYSGTVPCGWSGIVTPSKADYTFSPLSKGYSNVTANQTGQDYTGAGAIQTFTISGYVRTSGGAGISGVVMSGLPNSPTTDSSGYYSDTVSYGWSGTVTPSKAGYTFSPLSKGYSNVTADQTGQDYTGAGAIQTFTISGYVRTSGGTGISGVVMSGLPNSPTTDSSGYYSDTVSYGWSGTVTPSKAGYTFSPPSKSYSNVTSSQTGQDYTGQVWLVFNPSPSQMISVPTKVGQVTKPEGGNVGLLLQVVGNMVIQIQRRIIQLHQIIIFWDLRLEETIQIIFSLRRRLFHLPSIAQGRIKYS